jgi:Mg-chelatase subunit ChlD
MTDFYVIITDGDTVDQIAQGKRNADREVRDLTRMGCQVTCIGPMPARLADTCVDAFEGGFSMRQVRALAKGA